MNTKPNALARRSTLWLAIGFFCVAAASPAARAPVTAQVEIVLGKASPQAASTGHAPDASNVAVWLVSADESTRRAAASTPARPRARLVQKNKSFEPHVVVLEAGSMVEFPNQDPFFHNVFSLFEGKRFDLGLYEAGSSKSVRFDRPGVSFLFCNIHPEMSAVVVAVETPYYALSDRAGHLAIPDVPNGRYQLHVWYERGVAENLNSLTRSVVIDDSSRSIGRIQVAPNPDFTMAHKNKYGQDYVPPAGTPGYSRP
jgi:plastocyanin